MRVPAGGLEHGHARAIGARQEFGRGARRLCHLRASIARARHRHRPRPSHRPMPSSAMASAASASASRRDSKAIVGIEIGDALQRVVLEVRQSARRPGRHLGGAAHHQRNVRRPAPRPRCAQRRAWSGMPASARFSQPDCEACGRAKPLSSTSCASKCERSRYGVATACTTASCFDCHCSARNCSDGCSANRSFESAQRRGAGQVEFAPQSRVVRIADRRHRGQAIERAAQQHEHEALRRRRLAQPADTREARSPTAGQRCRQPVTPRRMSRRRESMSISCLSGA